MQTLGAPASLELRRVRANQQTGRAATNWFAIALWMLTLQAFPFGLYQTGKYDSAIYICAVLVCIGMVSLLMATIQLCPFRRLMFGNGVLVIFAAFLGWNMVIMINGLKLEYTYLRDLWGTHGGAWAWLVPTAMILGGSVQVWRRFLRVVQLMCWMVIPVILAGRTLGFWSNYGLCLLAPYSLLFWQYIPRRGRHVVLVGAVVALAFAVFQSGRTSVGVICLLMLCAAFLEFIRNTDSRNGTRRLAVVVTLTVAILAGFYVARTRSIPLAGSWTNQKVERFVEAFWENTRTSESSNLFLDFLADFKLTELVIGRGALGTYSVDWGSVDLGKAPKDRRNIECGYLQVILKGGLIALLGLLALAIPAAWLGLIQTRNWFTRSCALIILVRLIEMFLFGLPAAQVSYVTFWLAVGCCWSRSIRRMSEKDLMTAFHSSSQQRPRKLVFQSVAPVAF